MKKYQLQTTHYQQLLRACRQELKSLGYRSVTCSLVGAREFLGRMEKAGKTRLPQIEAGDIKAHYAYLQTRPSSRRAPLSSHTISGYLYDLKLFFAYAERHGLTTKNPLAGLRFASAQSPPRYVCSRAEIQQLYRACKDERERTLLHLLYGCGLRRMEVGALNLQDVDYAQSLLYVRRGKGRKRRVVPLNQQLVLHLRRYVRLHRNQWTGPESGAAYLLNDRATRLQKATLNRYFKRIVRRAKADERISPHSLRHSIATHLLQSGMALEQVRDFLGHAQLETTEIYTRIQTEEL